MSDEANSRADATLKRLSIEIHCEIVQRLGVPKATQLDVLTWLKKYHSVESSPGAFSRALPFIRQRVRSYYREQAILAWMQDEKSDHPEITDEELFRRGQRKFQIISIADEDPDAWVKIQRAARDREQLHFDQQRFQFDAAKMALKFAATLKAIASDNSLTEAEKVDRARQKLFGEVPA